MSRRGAILAAGVGTVLLVLGVVLGLVSGGAGWTGAPLWLGVPIGLLVLGMALWKLLRRPSGDAVAPAPWAEGGAIVSEPPESTPDTDPISGTTLAGIIEEGVSEARSEETVDAGLATVREPLRETLVATLRQGGWDRDRIEATLADGSWTDDRVAAAVLDENVTPPERSLRRRVWAWLFPQKAVRHRTGRAVGAIATAADAVLPPVVGQHAPRPMPVVEPTLEDLRRASDGSLRRAVEGRASVGATRYEKGDDGEDTAAADREGVTADRAGNDEAREADGTPADGADDWPTAESGGDG